MVRVDNYHTDSSPMRRGQHFMYECGYNIQDQRNTNQIQKINVNNLTYENHFNNQNSVVLDVYDYNLEEGFAKLRYLSTFNCVVAIDTEFPGIVEPLHPALYNIPEAQYEHIKSNIDVLKPIQFGFSFFDLSGNPLGSNSTIQFNFKWNRLTDLGNPQSMKLLKRSGIDFEKLEKNGITTEMFSEMFHKTDLMNNQRITWVGFHTNYDWAYLLKTINGWDQMPKTFNEFFDVFQIYFPRTFDVKTLLTIHDIPNCSLQSLSIMLKLKRHGSQHQAGSDSRLTGDSFFRFVAQYFNYQINPLNLIFGMNYFGKKVFQPIQFFDDKIESSSNGSSKASTDEEITSESDESNLEDNRQYKERRMKKKSTEVHRQTEDLREVKK